MKKETLIIIIEKKIYNTKLSLQICKENSFNEEYFKGYLQALESIYEMIK